MLRWRLVPQITLSCLLAIGWLQAADSLTGTYAMQGEKGKVILTLVQLANGGVQGKMQGGGEVYTLNGTPMAGQGILGTAHDAQGRAQAYFLVARRGPQVQLDLMGENADGDPDFTHKTTLLFTLEGGAEPTAPEPAAPEPAAASPGAASNANPFAQNAPPPSPFVGTFRGPELVMESQLAPDGSYRGTLALNGQLMPFTAKVVEGVLSGSFTVAGAAFPFTAKRAGGQLLFTSADNTLTLQAPAPEPSAPVNPFGGATGATTAGAAAGAAKAPEAAWKEFKHATGLAIRYPPTWTLAEAPGVPGMVLTPPDAEKTAEGPQEIYLVLAANAEGLKDVQDPRYYQQLLAQMAQLAPNLKVSGQPEKVQLGGQPGMIVTWTGKHPTLGHAVSAKVYGTIIKSFSAGILAMGKQERITQRDATLRAIFATLVAGAGERDPALVGRWKYWTYKSSANGAYSSERTSWLTLKADGTCLYSSKSESSASLSGKNAGGETTWTGGFAGQGSDGDRGSWTGSQGQAYVIWEAGGSEASSYKVQGNPGHRKLFLQRPGQKEPVELMEAP